MYPFRKGDNRSIKADDKGWTFADRRRLATYPASAIPTKSTEEGSMARTLSSWAYTVMPPAKHNRKRSSLLPSKPAYPTYIHTYRYTYVHTVYVEFCRLLLNLSLHKTVKLKTTTILCVCIHSCLMFNSRI